MKSYQEIIKYVLTGKYSFHKPSRSGVDMISRFGHYQEYDLSEDFPLVTARKINTKAIITELLWFLRGETNLRYRHSR